MKARRWLKAGAMPNCGACAVSCCSAARRHDQAQASSCFERALAIARRRGAKLWELRAAVSLARLWASQGEVARALDLLGPIYDWFTEGFHTKDLVDARALLSDLR